ncbi:glycosyltransferase [Segetibacter sp. 3557_3]|uniref:glycosyltransferase n=1 Tax=Segetibacter sp. 3557_3 TaxID=2547429 RepID=UPI001058533F|nr:glycosyltransferase [Segetibacter sp. 3557_3]TDH24642.1 glycosyltransferase [Segetibacter sp. 3557_3]
MYIVIFAHPQYLGHQSMPRFTNMLVRGLEPRGHTIEIFAPGSKWHDLAWLKPLRKWFGYIDQYIIFPSDVSRKIKGMPSETLFVFADQALGPWVPLVANRRHVIHCHDFLAQLSAVGKVAEHGTGWFGRQYQSFIRRGYSRGKHFISVSEKTKADLHQFIRSNYETSEVVYNGLNNFFELLDLQQARVILGNKVGVDLSLGYILHVGGNQWYKNRPGVVEIYNKWRALYDMRLPLLLIGEAPSEDLTAIHEQSVFQKDIHFISDLQDCYINMAYSGASVFIFPSYAEGFGWPIAEAMASGCPVITTNEAPMTEVAAAAGFYIGKRPKHETFENKWASEGAEMVNKVLTLSSGKRKEVVELSVANSKRFDTDSAIDQIEAIYLSILSR